MTHIALKPMNLSQRLNGTFLKSLVERIFDKQLPWSHNVVECGQVSGRWTNQSASVAQHTAPSGGSPVILPWRNTPTSNNSSSLSQTNRTFTTNYKEQSSTRYLQLPGNGEYRNSKRHYGTDVSSGRGSAGIQKQVSALTAKRPIRRKTKEKEADMLNVTAYATAEEYNLETLRSALDGPYTICNLPMDVENALFLQAGNTTGTIASEIFFFREGSVVFWNTPEMERNEVLKFLKDHSEDAYDLPSIMDELEQMTLTLTEQNTNLVGDTIHLRETEDEPGQTTLEKYAFSNAISHSVKLAMWEASLDKFVDSIEPVTDDLKDGRRVKMTRTQVLRKLGEIFALRHLINLSSDLLDTPDFYWEREHLEHLYQKTCSQLNISRRTRVMNERLGYCCSIMELLKEHLGDIHHTRLEWMIIILILFEVIFELQKMVFK
ncbi:hypothetical protein ScPMuIL_006606 [Solemya velum]